MNLSVCPGKLPCADWLNLAPQQTFENEMGVFFGNQVALGGGVGQLLAAGGLAGEAAHLHELLGTPGREGDSDAGQE